MINLSKAGIVLASAVGVAFAVTGCASQQSGAATPQNLPNNCAAYAQPAPVCKGQAHCKTVHRHKKTVVTTQTTTTTGGNAAVAQ
jgi:hypothetical protein